MNTHFKACHQCIPNGKGVILLKKGQMNTILKHVTNGYQTEEMRFIQSRSNEHHSKAGQVNTILKHVINVYQMEEM